MKSNLNLLRGLKLSIWRRAGNMLNIQFGDIEIIDNGTIGKYGLHVQCAWRIIKSDRIITGSDEL